MLRRLGSNAAANIVNGASAAVFQMAMTGLVAHLGRAGDLIVWSIAASLAGFVPLVACNLSATVTRRLASGPGAGDRAQASTVIGAARTVSRFLSGIAVVLAIVLTIAVPYLYHSLAGEEPLSAGGVVGLFFVGSSWVILAQPYQGFLLAGHRNWPITAVNTLLRVVVLAIFAAAVGLGAQLWSAVAMSSVAMWSGVVLMRRASDAPRDDVGDEALRRERASISGISRSMAVWGVTSSAVQAATVPVVAWIAPPLAAPMFLAFTLVTTFVGAIGAVANSLIAPMAGFVGRGDVRRAERTVALATVVLWTLFTIGALATYAVLDLLVPFWVGRPPADERTQALCFLLLALQHSLRNIGLPASIALAMGATSRAMLLSPLAEIVTVVVVAIPAAIFYGASGFLVGLAVSGFFGSLGVIYLTQREVLRSRSFVLSGVGVILTCFSLLIWSGLSVGR